MITIQSDQMGTVARIFFNCVNLNPMLFDITPCILVVCLVEQVTILKIIN